MNRILLSVLLISIMTAAKAQIPQQLNYQGIARNSSGSPVTYQNIKVRISLIDSAMGGQVAYSETRKVMTNYVGLFNILIGSPGAISVLGRMQDVNWLTGRKYIKLEIDPSGLTNFSLAGITQLQSVPYALSAASAAASGDAGGDLSGTYPAPTIANGAITNNKLAEGSVSISKLDPSVATFLTNKLNVSDTAAMLSAYATKSEINGSESGKLNISDTAAMLSPYYPAATAMAEFTATNASVSDLSTGKLNVSDTAAMLSPYYPAATAIAEFSATNANVSDLSTGKLSVSDTAAMLSPYYPAATAVAEFTATNASVTDLSTGKLNISDTAAMLSPYAMKADVDSEVAAATPTFATGTDGTDFNVSSSGTVYTLNVPDASATARGVVTIADQAFNGKKTFNSDLIVNGLIVGKGAGQNDQNTAIGQAALGSGTGTRNTAVGYGAMQNYSGTSFDNNTSVGYASFPNLTTGHANTSIGAETMMALTTGTENTAIGQQSLINATGDENTALGSAAGNQVTSGSRNTFLGRGSNVSTGAFSNATAIGYLAIVDADNKIQLGNTNVTVVNTSGKLTTGAVTYPNTDGEAGQVLTTNGSGAVSWSAASVREAADEFTATAAQTGFTLTQTPSANSKVKMYINGIRISNTAYSVSGATLTYNADNNGSYSLTASDRIQFDYFY